MRVEECAPAALVPAIDAVFVTGRGRAGSVAQRWPDLFQGGDGRAFAIVQDGVPSAGLVARPLRCVSPNGPFVAHAIGFVFTLPSHRRQGLASTLLQAVAERLDGPLVLWSTRPTFYVRLGWHPWDPDGACATWSGEAGEEVPPPPAVETAHLESIRDRFLPRRLIRGTADWQVRPFGTERLAVVAEDDAYALFFRHDRHVIVQEMVGAPAAFPRLWAQATFGCRSALVNLDAGSAAACWLAERGLAVVARPLALWLRWPLAERWSLDWIDRI